jgi:hypothetical protein
MARLRPLPRLVELTGEEIEVIPNGLIFSALLYRVEPNSAHISRSICPSLKDQSVYSDLCNRDPGSLPLAFVLPVNVFPRPSLCVT